MTTPGSDRSFRLRAVFGRPGHRASRGAAVGLLSLALALSGSLSLSGCASLGGGRVEVVRAEDVLNNGPILYDLLMTLHKVPGVSDLESPQVYDAIEKVRTTWPAADRVLRRATRLYKNGTGPAADLTSAFLEADELMEEIRALLARVKAVKPEVKP